MSVFRCEKCEEYVDSDYDECHEYKGGLICDDCHLELEEEETGSRSNLSVHELIANEFGKGE
jgi:hypothetical protein